MKHTPRVVVGLLALAIVVGCGRVPATHYYVLELQPKNPAADGGQGDGGHAIGVTHFQVDPPYDQDRIVYRIGASSPEVNFYPYHRWAAPLSRMLPRAVAAAFEGLRGVRAIEPVSPGRDYGLYLDGRLLALEEIDSPAGEQVRVRLKLTLRARDGRELWTDILAGESTLQTDQVRDLVEELTRLLERTLHAARPSLADALTQAN